LTPPLSNVIIVSKAYFDLRFESFSDFDGDISSLTNVYTNKENKFSVFHKQIFGHFVGLMNKASAGFGGEL